MINYSIQQLQNIVNKPNQDFDCLPRETQVIFMIEFIINSGNVTFSLFDIQQLFDKADMKSPRNGKKIIPKGEQLEKYVDRFIEEERLFAKKVDCGVYQVFNRTIHI